MHQHLTKRTEERRIWLRWTSQMRTTIEKTEEDKLVQNKQSVRRWRYRSGYTYLLLGETVRAGLVRAGRAAILHGDSTLQESPIKYHKCPTFDAKRRRFSVIWLTLQNRWLNTKMQMSLRKQTKTQECKWHKTIVHSLFLGCMYIQRNSNSLGEPCCS
jgi:hypothetical protein